MNIKIKEIEPKNKSKNVKDKDIEKEISEYRMTYGTYDV